MKDHPGNWTFEELAKYLHDPKSSIPGNKMAFVGIKDDTELADLLAYLRTLSDAPPALPG
jgi:cytochrome c